MSMPDDSSASFTTRKRALIDGGELSWGDSSDTNGKSWSDAVESSAGITFTENGTVKSGRTGPNSGLARWKFEQDVVDSWGDNDAVDNTTAGYTTNAATGKYAKSFSTGGGSIEVPWTHTDGVSEFSFAIYFRINSFNNQDGIMLKRAGTWNNSYGLSHDTNGTRFIASVNKNGISQNIEYDTSNLSTDTWYHSVMTFNTGTSTLYINGNKIGVSSSGPTTTPNISDNLYFGEASGAGRFLGGALDDARAYSKELTVTEVTNLYNTGSIMG